MNKKLFLIPITALIAGCGSSVPSESDIKKNIISSFSNCETVKITDIEKTNGQESEIQNNYLVDFKLKFETKGAPGARELHDKLAASIKKSQEYLSEKIEFRDSFAEKKEKINSKLQEERNEFIKYVESKPLSDFPYEESFSNTNFTRTNNYRGMLNFKEEGLRKIEEKYKVIYHNEIDSKIKNNEDEYNEKISKLNLDEMRHSLKMMKSKFDNSCLLKDKLSLYIYMSLGESSRDSYLGLEKNMSYKNIKMKKTENGWLFDL